MNKLPALAVLLVLAACGGSGDADEPAVTKTVTKAPTPTTPKTFDATGHIDVDGSSYILAATGTRVCMPDDGYDDMTPGAQVTVSSPNGDVVAVGRLDSGVKHGSYTCRFPFTVDDIPEGFPLYSVEVGHRGALTYTEAEMQAGLAFTLGG